MKWFDLKWLKQWWPEVVKRKPHVGKPKAMRVWFLFRHGSDKELGRMPAATKSEARSLYKRHIGGKRLAIEYHVKESV